MFKDIRAMKKQVSNHVTAINKQTRAIELLEARISDITNTAAHRWDWLNGELKRLAPAPPPQVELAHVDAPNVKVKYDVADVVQALADHFGLGYLPEEGAQIVVLKGE